MNQSPDLPNQARLEAINDATCVVVKVGTRVLTTPDGKLDRRRIDILASQLCRLADTDRQVLLVSSGAVGAGVGKLGLEERPTGLSQLQAIAAIGQTDLIQAYEMSLALKGRHAAQVLLTAADLRRRTGYLHVRNALTQIHAFGAIAIINENDSVAVSELKTTFGDNDRLAAQVAGLLVDALLIILSDIEGLYDGPPSDPASTRIDVVEAIDDRILGFAHDRLSKSSKGGMASKLKAAKLATRHGHPTIIAPGRDDHVLDKIFAGESVGTLFLARKHTIRGRRRWIGAAATVAGSLQLDAGAADALATRGSSLLAVGVTAVNGSFGRGSIVAMLDPWGNEVARGLCNYRSSEVEKILGQPSDRISELLGHCPYDNVVHRDNLVLTEAVRRR
ncbi:Glutamate 5-kinase [Rubripirellula lacrimiformis]|uniref:Glutamate 5-kinase n=1 Tax=Rubripirellula lacrimiformis TaxID=1930273 RepID=A0A517NKR8_9BACT|nr:glutamate 5-kinase [Rubripirellula lacrimiformis]QDT07735.1 Glutamate 5-kinase [Rubripirellula lacrimiformis]